MNTIKFINIAKRITAVVIIASAIIFLISTRAHAWDYLSENETYISIEVETFNQIPPARTKAKLSITCWNKEHNEISIYDNNSFLTLDKIGGRVKFDKLLAASNIISMVLEQGISSEILNVPEVLKQKIYKEIQESYGALFEITIEGERRFYEFIWGNDESQANLKKFVERCPTLE